MKNKRATINDVAKLAGVSTSTVSVVINNKEKYISPKLREKVNHAISVLNYQPNLLARGLKIQETKSIGLILTNITSPVIPPMVRNVQRIAQQEGFDTFIVASEENIKTQNDAIRSMLAKRVDGLIICPVISEEYKIIQNAVDLIPVVTVERPLPGTSSVFTNNKETTYKIASHLIEHGYRNIGLIQMQVFGSNTRDRIEGYQQALIEHQLYNPDLIRETDYVGQSAFNAMQDLLRTNKIDAIMTTSQSIALGVFKAIMALGMKIPEDIAVFGYDDLPWMEVVEPKISTTRQPIKEIAIKSCEILFSALTNGDESIQSHCIDTEIIFRRSCGCK